MFQFLLGRLETVNFLSSPFSSSYMFQFLIGRLETRAPGNHTGGVSMFQFLIGRLRTEQKVFKEVFGI